MAKGVAKRKNLQRSREDDRQPRSVKRKTTHDLQENGDEQIDIDSSLKNKARRQFIQNMLELKKEDLMCSCTGCKIGRRREREKATNHGCGEEKSETMILKMSRYMNTVYHATAHLEEKISGKTLLQNSRCRFCADTPSCPLQSHNIISKETPVEINREKVNKGENNEIRASKKARRKR
ncbi:hypothetical protein BOTCAL_0032g00430 [Botryotinia calthae]|uniref:Uncharacterized protein n=1 Tax=Botryotinia calthae TaxID=38488 RepID=A0A4Y8DDF0_9HELO|nr:hypothetical protein BOTCAL_0032g00430 [Botryotinia calthae]